MQKARFEGWGHGEIQFDIPTLILFEGEVQVNHYKERSNSTERIG